MGSAHRGRSGRDRSDGLGMALWRIAVVANDARGNNTAKKVEIFEIQTMEVGCYGVENLETELGIQGM